MSPLPTLDPTPGRPARTILRIAHRGLDGQERYTEPDLLELARQGAHLVEFDVAMVDNQLIAGHDGDGLASTPPIPEIVAGAAKAGLALYVDVKSVTRTAAEELIALLRAEGMASLSILASFDPEVVAMLSELAPDMLRSVLFFSPLDDAVALAASTGAQYLHPCWEWQPDPDQLLAGAWLGEVRAAGLGVICWHEERPAVLRNLCALGVDGICTDDTALLTGIAEAF